jgi:hypothetical protein
MNDYEDLVSMAKVIIENFDYSHFGFFTSNFDYSTHGVLEARGVVEYGVTDLEDAMTFALTANKNHVYLVATNDEPKEATSRDMMFSMPRLANAPAGYDPKFRIFSNVKILMKAWG